MKENNSDLFCLFRDLSQHFNLKINEVYVHPFRNDPITSRVSKGRELIPKGTKSFLGSFKWHDDESTRKSFHKIDLLVFKKLCDDQGFRSAETIPDYASPPIAIMSQ